MIVALIVITAVLVYLALGAIVASLFVALVHDPAFTDMEEVAAVIIILLWPALGVGLVALAPLALAAKGAVRLGARVDNYLRTR